MLKVISDNVLIDNTLVQKIIITCLRLSCNPKIPLKTSLLNPPKTITTWKPTIIIKTE